MPRQSAISDTLTNTVLYQGQPGTVGSIMTSLVIQRRDNTRLRKVDVTCLLWWRWWFVWPKSTVARHGFCPRSHSYFIMGVMKAITGSCMKAIFNVRDISGEASQEILNNHIIVNSLYGNNHLLVILNYFLIMPKWSYIFGFFPHWICRANKNWINARDKALKKRAWECSKWNVDRANSNLWPDSRNRAIVWWNGGKPDTRSWML